MQRIHVHRYTCPQSVGYQGWIEPEDRSWLLFLDADGLPSLYQRTTDDLGRIKYVNVETFQDGIETETLEATPAEPVAVPTSEVASSPSKLTFHVEPYELTPEEVRKFVTSNEMLSGHFPDTPTHGYRAWLDQRSIVCFGLSEHEAIENLLNYVAQLCTAGCLDHTGAPAPMLRKRRYETVFGLSK